MSFGNFSAEVYCKTKQFSVANDVGALAKRWRKIWCAGWASSWWVHWDECGS